MIIGFDGTFYKYVSPAGEYCISNYLFWFLPDEYKFNVCSGFILPLLLSALFDPTAFFFIHWKDFCFIVFSFNSSVYIIYQGFYGLYYSLVEICSNVPCHYPYSARRCYTIRKFQVFFKSLFFLTCKICYFFPFVTVRKKSKYTY